MAWQDVFHQVTRAANLEGHVSGDDLVRYAMAGKQTPPGQVPPEAAHHLKACDRCDTAYTTLSKLPYEKLEAAVQRMTRR